MFGNIILTVFFFFLDREDSTKESDFALDDDADEDEEGNDWDGELSGQRKRLKWVLRETFLMRVLHISISSTKRSVKIITIYI